MLLETSAEKAGEISLESMQYLIDKQQYIGIVLSASRPYKTLFHYIRKKVLIRIGLFSLIVCQRVKAWI